jgi:hypothetical protein
VHPDYKQAQFTIKELARELHNPTVDSMARLKHCVRHLAGELDQVQVMDPDITDRTCRITVDSDWGGCQTTRKSTGTLVAWLMGTQVLQSTKTQPTIATSSAQAESAEVQRGAHLGIFMQNLWYEAYGESLDIVVETDSAAGKILCSRRGVGRVRHLEIRDLEIQELTNSGRVRVTKVPGEQNVADLGTKVLDRVRIEYLLNKLGVRYFRDGVLMPITSAATKTKSNGVPVASVMKILSSLAGLVISEGHSTQVEVMNFHLVKIQPANPAAPSMFDYVLVLVVLMIVAALVERAHEDDEASCDETTTDVPFVFVTPKFEKTKTETKKTAIGIDVQSQSMVTYRRDLATPRFQPLAEREQGCWPR